MKHKQIKKILESLDLLILAIKATGGYKYQEKFRLSEKEIADYVVQGRHDLRKVIISLYVAEEMLKSQPVSSHSRWKEYLERRDEAMKV